MADPKRADQSQPPPEDEAVEDLEAPAESQDEVAGGVWNRCGCYDPCGELTDYTT